VSKLISQNIAVLLAKCMPFLKPTMFCIEGSILIVEFSTESYALTLKDLQQKNSLIQWQFKIAGFNLHAGLCMRSKVFF
jgi:hypothetical protein